MWLIANSGVFGLTEKRKSMSLEEGALVGIHPSVHHPSGSDHNPDRTFGCCRNGCQQRCEDEAQRQCGSFWSRTRWAPVSLSPFHLVTVI